MRSRNYFTMAPLLALLLSCAFLADGVAQTRRESRAHTFAPLPSLLQETGMNATELRNYWEVERRAEILQLFRDHVYGSAPATVTGMHSRVTFLDRNALDGMAVQKEVEVTLVKGGRSLTFTLLLFLPRDHQHPVPLFLGLNFYGNQTLLPDPRISLPESWTGNNEEIGIDGHRATDASRGTASGRWPVELILSRGYGLATVYAGDIDPDFDDGFTNGVHALFPEEGGSRDPGAWGTLAAWAWGLSRSLDYLETDPDVDAGRVAVIGHSRMGKAALWAGAADPRFAMVISNDSGCGGAALSRRAHGERVSQINERFPHWFATRFRDYNDHEDALPVDQHMLLALVAPRPLYVASAEEDEWADPYGEYLSLYYGSRIYQLYGNPPLPSDRLPAVNQPLQAGRLGYHIRTGGHDLTLYDWERYLDFADIQWKEERPVERGAPLTGAWIREHLQSVSPRLILGPDLEARIRKEIMEKDPLTLAGLALLEQRSEEILDLEPLTYQKQGRRLLGVSREALRRLTTLALAFRFENDDRYLQRMEQELQGVCGFRDWNPSHFLDVAEMAAGVALALDWTAGALSPETEALARRSLVEKALEPGLHDTANIWWTTVDHNWNLVCHGGLSLAALAVFEEVPDLATAVLARAVEEIPLALEPYAPSGVYPEGPSYWFYATSYLTLAISAFESALGAGFGFLDAPGVRESALFSEVLAAPSGEYFNYFDAGLEGYHSEEHFGLLSWFSSRSGPVVDTEEYTALLSGEREGKQGSAGSRLSPVYFLYSAELPREENPFAELPLTWIGWGREPLAVFRGNDRGEGTLFLAGKGGCAADNHGNMDAGSFVFELDGVRWSVDPGNQDYFTLEQLMGQDLWDQSQESRRWSLLTKNNFGHSTLTLNGQLHVADARALIDQLDLRGAHPTVTFDLTPLFGEAAGTATRSFTRVSDQCMRITDRIGLTPETRTITWQMITQAEAMVRGRTVFLRQDGRQLALYLANREPAEVNVVQLDPPPLPYDKRIPGLKRIEITLNREDLTGPDAILEVELNSDIYQRR